MSQPSLAIELADRPLDPAVLGLLTRLELRESDDDPSVIALRFRLVQRGNGEWQPVDEEHFFEPAAKLALDLAAPGGRPRRVFEGFVTHVRPHFETIESNCYLEVLAMDAAVLLDVHQRVQVYPDQTEKEAVEQVFGRYDIEVEAEDTTTRFEEHRIPLIQRGSDWAFVRECARRNGFVCYLEYDDERQAVVAHFGPPNFDGDAQPDLIILQPGENLAWFDVQLSSTRPLRSTGAVLDPFTGEVHTSSDGDDVEEQGEGGLADHIESRLTAAGAQGTSTMLSATRPISTVLDAIANATTRRSREVIEGRGELDPALYRGLIRARRPALVRGLGRSFSGAWYIRAVRTVYADAALTQTFVAVRNATGQSGAENFGQSAEEVAPT